MNIVENSQGKVFYGMHFYPGLARYDQADKEALTVFINENTIRKMGPSFAGRPVFVEHVDNVDNNINDLRGEADGWVIESFFNEADGKNWVKFIVVSDRGFDAIKHGFRLSNAYTPECQDTPGTWNGIPYQQEVVGGEFEHLAIVQNPRYEESVIMSPEQFKAYNETKKVELYRFANSKEQKGEKKMKLFKRAKVENSTEIEGMMVELPKSKKEVSLTACIEGYDKFLNMNGYANGDHMVKVGNDEMSVNDLVKKHMEACNSMEEMKAKNAAREDGGEPGPDDKDAKDPSMDNDSEKQVEDAGMADVGDRGGDASLDNEEDEEEMKKKKEDKKSNAMTLEEAKKIVAKEKAARLRNAHLTNASAEVAPVVMLPRDQVARGKVLYGSGN